MRVRILFLLRVVCTVALLSIPVSAADVKQQAAALSNLVDLPSIGYVVRAEIPELRAMLGVPGAARFSEPIPLPDGTVSPTSRTNRCQRQSTGPRATGGR